MSARFWDLVPYVPDWDYHHARHNGTYIICRACGHEITGRREWSRGLHERGCSDCTDIKYGRTVGYDVRGICEEVWRGSYRRYLKRESKNWAYNRKRMEEEKRWLRISKKRLKELRKVIKEM